MKTTARSLCVVLLAVLALAGTGPAGHAKGPTEVTVSGPGIDAHLTYTDPADDVDSGTLGDASQVYDMWNAGRLGQAPDLSADELGPRYVLTWSGGPHSGGEADVVVQHAYPFAEGGAWVEFLPDQQLYGADVAAGWVPAPRLRAALVELGAVGDPPPPEAATAEPSAQASAAPSDAPPEESGTGYRVLVPVGVLVAGALVAGVLVARRRLLSR